MKLRTKLQKAGGLEPKFRKCPKCHGPAQLGDNSPGLKPKYRYSVICKNKDCVVVMAPTVKAALDLWKAEYK